MPDQILRGTPYPDARPAMPVLYVLVERVLLRTNLHMESLALLLSQRPGSLLLLPLWLMRGPRHLWRSVAARVQLDPAVLPFNQLALAQVEAARKAGREVVLVSDLDPALMQAVVARTGARPELAQARGFALPEGVEYLRTPPVESGRRGTAYAYFVAIRPHQWLKNLLLFLPLIAAHRLGDMAALTATCIGFAAFCCAASAGYLINDLLDINSDRRHVRKHRRPFAAGEASVAGGLALTLVLLGGAAALGMLLPGIFRLSLFVYLCGTLAYSTWLKRRPVIDVLTLAGLYTLRALAGSAATGIAPSFWLLALSMFVFVDLACVKRYVELSTSKLEGATLVPGRGYAAVDRETVFSIGSGCGLMAVLVLALYVQNPDTVKLYPVPEVLWGLCPLFMFWSMRIWILARRGEVHDDPLMFTMTDRMSLVTFALMFALLWLGSSGDGLLSRVLGG